MDIPSCNNCRYYISQIEDNRRYYEYIVWKLEKQINILSSKNIVLEQELESLHLKVLKMMQKHEDS